MIYIPPIVFENKTQYLDYRKQWTFAYNQISEAIRVLKQGAKEEERYKAKEKVNHRWERTKDWGHIPKDKIDIINQADFLCKELQASWYCNSKCLREVLRTNAKKLIVDLSLAKLIAAQQYKISKVRRNVG